MDDSLKKRLIGAVVLVSLAVIFVPMLVEDEPVVSGHITETNIPPRPELPTVDPQAQTSGPGVGTPMEGGGQSFALPMPESSSAPDSSPVQPDIAPPPPPPIAEVPEKAAGPAPVETQPAPEKPASATPAKPAGSEGWVVQVGSFSDKGNADSVTDRLLKGGFKAFLEEIRVSDKVLYRVRVGPEAERERAVKLQAEIDASLKLKGQVRSHP